MDVDRYLLRDGPAKMLCGEALKMVVTDNGTVLMRGCTRSSNFNCVGRDTGGHLVCI